MSREPQHREDWVDVAKGGAIVLVVLFHASLFLSDVGLASAWPKAGLALDTFRMPLFFAMAGLFAASTLSRGLRSVLSRRVYKLVWLYVLWSFIWTAAFQVLPLLREEPTWRGFLLVLVWPNASTWFIYGLALYFLAAWFIRGLPAWAQLAMAAALSIVFGTGAVDTGSTALNKMAMYFVFYLSAVHFGPMARTAAKQARVWHAITASAAYLAVIAAVGATDAFRFPGVRLGVSYLAIFLGVTLAVSLTGRPAFRWLQHLGGRTLPIYVLHYYPILVLCALVKPIAPHLEWAAPALPPVLTAGAIAFALLVERATRRVPGLYDLPTSRERRAVPVPGRVPPRSRA